MYDNWFCCISWIGDTNCIDFFFYLYEKVFIHNKVWYVKNLTSDLINHNNLAAIKHTVHIYTH